METTHTYLWTSFVIFWLDDTALRTRIHKALGLQWTRYKGDASLDHIEFLLERPITDDDRKALEEKLKVLLPSGSVAQWQGTMTTVAPTSLTFTQ